jgi:hypothetical protein
VLSAQGSTATLLGSAHGPRAIAPRRSRVVVRRGVVHCAAAPNYGAEEFQLPWSPNLVPPGPWKLLDGCVHASVGRQDVQLLRKRRGTKQGVKCMRQFCWARI